MAAAVGFLFYFWSDQFLAPPDCAFYWAWADALLHGPTLNFIPAFQKLQIPAWYGYITETGRMANDWPMGTGLLLLPAAWAGPVWAHAWEILLLVLVLCFWWRAVPGTRLQKASSLTGLIVGTPLLFYALFGPFFSHAASFIVVTAFLVLWSRDWENHAIHHWTILGMLLGVATLVRPQNALLAVVFLADWRWFLDQARENHRTFSQRVFLPIFLGLVLGLAPRFPAYAVLYGSPLALPKLEEMQWLNPNIGKTLLSEYHGILPWTPIYALGIAGLLLGLRRQRRLCAGLLLVFLVQFYINSANQVWWSGGSFGNRRLTDYSIVIAWGLLILASSTKRALRIGAGTATVLCCAWTFTLLLAERRLIAPLDRYVPLTSDGFFRRLTDIYLQPLETWRSLTRAVGVNSLHRLAATAALFLSVGAALSFSRMIKLKIPVRIASIILILVQVVLLAWVAIAALRTPPVEPALQAQFGNSSAILWDNYTELAGYHMVREEFTKANTAAERAIFIRPDAPAGYWYSGVALLQSGAPAKAADRFREVLRLSPDHHNAGELLQIAENRAGAQLPVTNNKPASQPEADWRVK